MNELAERAIIWAVEPGYEDAFGKWHDVSPATLVRLIDALSGERERPPNAAAVAQLAEQARAFQGDGRRVWALATQLYAVRSRSNWGHGDFSDLLRLVELAASRGASAIGLNPLHALFPDRAEQASPYAPNSRLFLNLLYIDIEAIPEFPGVAIADLEAEVKSLRASEMVAYARVAQAKLVGLRLAYDCFSRSATAQRRADFVAYRQEQGDALLRFACFECLRQRYAPKPWPQWPQQWRKPDSESLREFRQTHRDDCEFQEFVQWIADRQLKACKDEACRRGLSIGLYIDLAIGIDPHGADAWSQQDSVLKDVSIGAPPDEFNPAGQDWGLAPFNPHALAADDFAPMRQLMRAAMRHAGAIRLDHVLGLKRIFMIPHGCQPAEGTYVRFPFEQLLHVIAEESNRCRCIVIGEDLGTVPQGFRETLARWGLWTYRVMLFERERDGHFLPPEAYPLEAVASFNTHDLPSFRGWLQSHDLHVKQRLGLDPGESDEARARAQQMLRAALIERVPGHATNDVAAIASFLAATPSRLVVISLEDILGEIEQVNIPGTTDQHPNWRRKLTVAIDDFERNGELKRVAQAFAEAGRACWR
jgi:4-alpha-glucanotransferase